MGLFGSKGKSRDELIAESAELNVAPEQEEKKDDVSTGNQKIDIELTKIAGRLEGLDEVRKASSERFSRVSEQIGELRGMIVDTNKAMGKVEVTSTKAVDLVESVHPEKLMIEVRKQDGKLEALRASIESNEAIMKDLMLELKRMRDKMNFYKGIEQVMQLNEETKQELATMKRVEATIERHADKVETIFIEVEKKFGEFDKFNDVVKDLDKSFKKLVSDFEKLRTKVDVKQERKEFVDLLDRFNEFERHTTNLLKLLDERNKTVKDELSSQFRKLVQQYRAKLDTMRPLAEPAAAPAQSAPVPTEPAEGNSGEDGAGADAKPGLFSRIKGMISRKPKEEEAPQEEQVELFPESSDDATVRKELEKAQAQVGKNKELGVKPGEGSSAQDEEGDGAVAGTAEPVALVTAGGTDGKKDPDAQAKKRKETLEAPKGKPLEPPPAPED